MKGLFGQMEFFLQAVLHVVKQTLGLYSPIILLAVIFYFFYYKK